MDFSFIMIRYRALYVVYLQHLTNISVSSLADKKKLSSILRASATMTTIHCPFFYALAVNPAVGKAARWIRSEILRIFFFFTSSIVLPRAEKTKFV